MKSGNLKPSCQRLLFFGTKCGCFLKIFFLTKKVEFTLSSKIIQAACLFLFSGSVSKLSFNRIIIDETCQFCFKTHRRAIIFFSFSFCKSYHKQILLLNANLPSWKNKYFIPTKHSVKTGRRSPLGNFLTSVKYLNRWNYINT